MVTDKTFTKEFTKQVEDLFAMGAHLGHKKNRLHPRARKYVYKIVNGTSIIDLTLTVSMLIEAKRALKEAARSGQSLLVVATKKVINQKAAAYCKEHGIPAITAKWLPGLLTNFETIMKNVTKLKNMQKEQSEGVWDKYVKHERMKLEKEMQKLNKLYGGIVDLKKRPDIILVVDIKKEQNAITEAGMYDIPVIAIADTNGNVDRVRYPIVMNDDAPEVVVHVFTELANTFTKTKPEEKQPELKKTEGKKPLEETVKN